MQNLYYYAENSNNEVYLNLVVDCFSFLIWNALVLKMYSYSFRGLDTNFTDASFLVIFQLKSQMNVGHNCSKNIKICRFVLNSFNSIATNVIILDNTIVDSRKLQRGIFQSIHNKRENIKMEKQWICMWAQRVFIYPLTFTFSF